MFGEDRVTQADADLTQQHDGEPRVDRRAEAIHLRAGVVEVELALHVVTRESTVASKLLDVFRRPMRIESMKFPYVS